MNEYNNDLILKRLNLIELQKKINTHKRLLECLELRLYLIDNNRANKSEYDKNEDEITKIITCSKIDSVMDRIFNLELEFKKTFIEL